VCDPAQAAPHLTQPTRHLCWEPWTAPTYAQPPPPPPPHGGSEICNTAQHSSAQYGTAQAGPHGLESIMIRYNIEHRQQIRACLCHRQHTSTAASSTCDRTWGACPLPCQHPEGPHLEGLLLVGCQSASRAAAASAAAAFCTAPARAKATCTQAQSNTMKVRRQGCCMASKCGQCAWIEAHLGLGKRSKDAYSTENSSSERHIRLLMAQRLAPESASSRCSKQVFPR
jgi:hypothetical protein